MTTMEIVLLVVGGIAVFLSFILPEGKKKHSRVNTGLIREEIKNAVTGEVDQIRSHVEDVVEESMQYAMEKTERSLERLSNEKIMAVSEYSDTVLSEINKNHKEVMFLYDMLNDKHQNMVSIVSDVEKTLKEAEEAAREAREIKKEIEDIIAEQTSGDSEYRDESCFGEEFRMLSGALVGTNDSNLLYTEDTADSGQNNNDRILELYKAGKSKVEIARELGLGVGEVKLVIDLYKGLQNEGRRV